jgi:methylmalonyl-CoA mutase cobalamin-binding subunit
LKMKTVVAAALGECVHVAGVSNFLNLAEIAGWRTVFLGPAIPIDQVLKAALDEKADMVGVSYRLTPENGELLLGQFAEEASDLRASGVRFVFGGTPPVAERVKSIGFFERVFDGSEKPEAVLAFLKGQVGSGDSDIDYPQKTMERMNWKSPYPLLRHHFGLPTMESTIKGIELIALAKTLDIISLGIDQDAQENFFHSERQDLRRKGAGGVPVRTVADYQALYAATRMGNYPLLRTYSGTDDFIRLAEMYVDTINIAWCAIPLFWFNQMDGRGPWDLEGSIREHQRVMTWYGEHDLPVELNEPHHWGMRDAPDVVFVVSAFLAAYNAKKFGVHDYIVQMMFNSPPGTSDAMDLAKMLAILELVSPLSGPDFHIIKQTRTGLLSYPLDPEEALGHLAASIYLQMTLHPDIVHIVGHTEANHAATAEDVITASKVARRAIENAVRGAPNFKIDPIVQTRKEELISEAHITLDAIHKLVKSNVKDPWADPATLAKAVTSGILDAPQLKNNRFGRGTIQSKIIKGMCLSVDPSGKSINEKERLSIIKKEEE